MNEQKPLTDQDIPPNRDRNISIDGQNAVGEATRRDWSQVFLEGALYGILANNIVVLSFAVIINSLLWGLYNGIDLGVSIWAPEWLLSSFICAAIPGGLLMVVGNHFNGKRSAQIFLACLGGFLGIIIQFLLLIVLSILGILDPWFWFPIYIGQ